MKFDSLQISETVSEAVKIITDEPGSTLKVGQKFGEYWGRVNEG